MILTAKKIEKEVKEGNITITPFNKSCLSKNSYIYHISNLLLEVDNIGDIKNPISSKSITIPDRGLLLEPHKLYLGTTGEVIGSKDYVTSLIGMDKTSKLGMYVQVTADLGQLGKAHQWTLEIEVIQPLVIYPWTEIGQVTFWKPYGNYDRNNIEFYSTQNRPHTSTMYKELGE